MFTAKSETEAIKDTLDFVEQNLGETLKKEFAQTTEASTPEQKSADKPTEKSAENPTSQTVQEDTSTKPQVDYTKAAESLIPQESPVDKLFKENSWMKEAYERAIKGNAESKLTPQEQEQAIQARINFEVTKKRWSDLLDYLHGKYNISHELATKVIRQWQMEGVAKDALEAQMRFDTYFKAYQEKPVKIPPKNDPTPTNRSTGATVPVETKQEPIDFVKDPQKAWERFAKSVKANWV